MSQQIQQLEHNINILKIRSFDLQEALTQKTNELSQYTALVTEIVKLLGIHDDGQGIGTDAIIGALKALLPAETEAAQDEQLLVEAE